jgi:putative transposase
MDKFKNKYRIPSARLEKWNYEQNGAYFITICTQNKEHYFGNVIDGIMNLSEMGLVVQEQWLNIPNLFPFVSLDSFVIMPNHIHGILYIDKKHKDICHENPINSDEEINKGGITKDKNPMLNLNLSRIIRWFKGRTSYEIRKIHADFQWQPRFHDHIIKNHRTYKIIVNYINNNPSNWQKDKFNKK